MFYSQLLLAKKGPLAKIWLAAHFEKKLTRHQIFSTDIPTAVESVINPPEPLALRVSGHLMLGIVKIYSKKVNFLMSDVSEAMWKIKLAFRPGNVDLVESGNAAGGNAVDDPRYFGNIYPETDFPELADIAFSQNMLANYKRQNGAKDVVPTGPGKRSLISPAHSISLDESNLIQVQEGGKRHSTDSSIGIPDVRGSEGGLGRNRPSLTVMGGGAQDRSLLDRDLSITGIGGHMDDPNDPFGDVALPAIDFDQDDVPFVPLQMTPPDYLNASLPRPDLPDFQAGDENGLNMMQQDLPPMNDANFPDYDQGPIDFQQDQDQQEQGNAATAAAAASVGPPAAEESAVDGGPGKADRPPPAKRRVVKIDERVELSSREIKEMMANLAPITRASFPCG